MKNKPILNRFCGVLLFFLLVIFFSCTKSLPDAKSLAAYTQAKIAYESGNAVDAAKILASLCKEWPDFHQAAFVRARALYFTASYEEAAAVLRQLVQDHPDHLEAALWLVRCLQAQKKHPEARTLLEHLISLNPDDTRILWLLALQSEDENKPNEAMGLLQRARSGDSDLALVHLEIARLYFQWGQMDKAQAEINRTIAMVEDNNPLKDSALQLAARLKSGGKP